MSDVQRFDKDMDGEMEPVADGEWVRYSDYRKAQEAQPPCGADGAAPVAPATVAVPDLFCVGRANYPQRGGNVGISWHVVGVADVPYRTCVPKHGELLFVLAAKPADTEGRKDE